MKLISNTKANTSGCSYVSKHQFTILDHSFATLNEESVIKSGQNSNPTYCSLRRLSDETAKFQDDIESLIYVGYTYIKSNTPWEKEFENQSKFKVYKDDEERYNCYAKLRLERFETHRLIMCRETEVIAKATETVNPFSRFFDFLKSTDENQEKAHNEFRMIKQKKQERNKPFSLKQDEKELNNLKKGLILDFCLLAQITLWPPETREKPIKAKSKRSCVSF